MSLIMWDKPEKVRTAEEQPTCDAGITGCYVPNMSKKDAATWKGKVVGGTTNSPQVELRKTFSRLFDNRSSYANVLIIVSLGNGYKYQDYITRDNSKGVNIHMSSNGSIHMTFNELHELQCVVEEAKSRLISLTITKCE